METERLWIAISDLRQYTYCPRIVYYRYCLPNVRPTTYTMQAGVEAHQQAGELERRRSLRAYHLNDGERRFDVWVESDLLALRGRVDMVIYRDGEIIPIEYKNSPGRMGRHVLLQLAAYGVVLEDEDKQKRSASRGFVYHIPARRASAVSFTADLKDAVCQTTAAIQEMILSERIPAPPTQTAKCAICEFRRFCNDVV
ncbi:MAG: CRISPR-associated protein Cas4 [Anaerolineae bacterium]|nr:CRISPR-associated protein Cas4 [Anaerolineae bacterium]